MELRLYQVSEKSLPWFVNILGGDTRSHVMTPYVSYALSTEEKVSSSGDFARNPTALST